MFKKSASLLAIIAIMAPCASPAFSQDCRVIRTVQNVGGQPVIVQGATCGQNFHVPVQHVQHVAPVVHHANQFAVLPVQVAPDYIFSVNDALRDKILVDAVVGRLAPVLVESQKYQAQLNQQLQQQTQLLQAMILQQQQAAQFSQQSIQQRPAQPMVLPMNQPQYQPPIYTQPKPPQIPILSPEPKQNISKKSAGVQVSPELKNLLDAKCIRCHGENNVVKGNFDMSSLEKLSVADWNAIFMSCEDGSMPKDSKPLTSEELTLVREAAKQSLRASRTN